MSRLQYLAGWPDRQAVDLLRYHAGGNFALHRQLGDERLHPPTRVNFRQRLLEELDGSVGSAARPEFGLECWERSVESQTD